MKTVTLAVRWGNVVWAGTMAPLVSIVLIFLAVVAFAMGQPGHADAATVARFADGIVPWALPGLVIVLTEFFCLRHARRARAGSLAQGALTGAVAGLVTCLLSVATGGMLNLALIIVCSMAVASGTLGSMVGVRLQLAQA